MTCIVGLVHKNKVYIGGDSAGVAGYDISIRKDKKVFQNGPMIFGFTSSFRMGQLLQYALVIPDHPKDMDTFQYMTVILVDAIRACMLKGGFLYKDKEQESGGTFLVGYKGRLFRIAGDFQVGEHVCLYDAVGCGDNFALGSLFTSKSMKPKDRVKKALEAAANFSAGVIGPFNIVEL